MSFQRFNQRPAGLRSALLLAGVVAAACVISWDAAWAEKPADDAGARQLGADSAVLAAARQFAETLQGLAESVDPDRAVGPQVESALEAAVSAARQRAVRVAALNGLRIDPRRDVLFGRWIPANGRTQPARFVEDASVRNAIRVIVRGGEQVADNRPGNPPAIPVLLAVAAETDLAVATAVFDPRDVVVVMDYSASMNDDSELKSLDRIGRDALEENMRNVFAALGPPNVGRMTFRPQPLELEQLADGTAVGVQFRNDEVQVASRGRIVRVALEFNAGGVQSFRGRFGRSTRLTGAGRFAGQPIDTISVTLEHENGPTTELRFEDTADAVLQSFQLDDAEWPWPSGSWRDFVLHCRNNRDVRAAGYARQYGGLCLVDYLLDKKSLINQCPDLWQTPHFPLHACKAGMTSYLQFLQALGMEDRIGLVAYAGHAQVQQRAASRGRPKLSDADLNRAERNETDLETEPLSSNFATLDTIQRRLQAGQFGFTTGTGFGLRDARQLLAERGRRRAEPTILLVTDGHANASPNGWSPPPDWSWDDVTDFNGDGRADYTSDLVHKQYAFHEALSAVRAGCRLHTLTVGADADRAFMQAVAKSGGGEWTDVPAEFIFDRMHARVLQAFAHLATDLPTPRLVSENTR